MSLGVDIQFTPNALAVIKSAADNPAKMRRGIARGMNKAAALVVLDIQARRLTGQGPFPPSQHKLGIVSNRLRASLRASRAVVSGDEVTLTIGTNVKYARIHEFGGTIKRKSARYKMRFANGKLVSEKDYVRFQKNEAKLKQRIAKQNAADVGRYLREVKKSKYDQPTLEAAREYQPSRQLYTREGETGDYEIKMPARAPIQTGIQENAATFSRFVKEGVQQEMQTK